MTKKVGGGEITFYVNDVAYTALDGMTWEEWVNSSYNINGFFINSYGFIQRGQWGPVIFDDDNDRKALGNDVIRASGIYAWVTDDATGPA